MNTHRGSKVILCHRPHILPNTKDGYYGKLSHRARTQEGRVSEEIPQRFVFVCIGGVRVYAESRIALGITDLF